MLQYNVPPPLQPALGASLFRFHIETLAASLCSRSTITYGAAALGCDVPTPLFCKQRSLSNLFDAHSLDGPEKKPTVDLERREVTVFTHRTCRHWIGWSFLWYQQLYGIIIYLLTWVSSSILSVISFKYAPHMMEWASCSSSFFFPVLGFCSFTWTCSSCCAVLGSNFPQLIYRCQILAV